MIRIGKDNEMKSNGLIINPPFGLDVLWVMIRNDIFESFRLSQICITGDDCSELDEIYSGGQRYLNNISPDGGLPEFLSSSNDFQYHTWI